MKFTPIRKENLPPGRSPRLPKNFQLLTEFANSEYDVAIVEDGECLNAENLYHSLYKSIKRFNMTGIKALKRQGKVFLIKET